MPVGRFMLVLHSHMPYVLSHGKSPHGTDWLFESAAECYLPLLDALDRLANQGVHPRWTVNMTPILAEQLDDEAFKSGFEEYCEEKIQAALVDQKHFRAQGELGMEGLAAMWQRVYTRALVQFKHKWQRDICAAWRAFEESGSVELITCGATHGYFPLLSTDESVQAQVKLAVSSHEKRFGRKPKGMWLPECAYRPAYDWKAPVEGATGPWPRKDVSSFLVENGVEYFFVDSHMIRGGEPLGTYWQKFPHLAEMFARTRDLFVQPEEFRSEYEHYRVPSGCTIFARDPQSTVKVWSGDVGYPGDPHYLEFHKQLYPGRLRYWRISEDKADLGRKGTYEPWRAFENIGNHAADFVEIVKGTLAAYKGKANRTGTLVAMYDTELFGHWWWEGPEFLYETALRMHNDPDLAMCSGSDVLADEPARHMVHLPEGSWGEGGYHSVWLNPDNHWTWTKLYPCEEAMREMARTMADGPAKEIVEQCARELVLAEASDWQFLISTWSARDYSEIRIQDHFDRFDALHALALKVHSGEPMTSEDETYLKDCQQKDAPFPEIDVSYWAWVEHPLPVPAL